MEKWIAEFPSLHSAASQSKGLATDWLPYYSKSRQALCGIFLGLFIHPWESWELIDRVKDSAYHQQYQGGWEQVQVFLEQVHNFSGFEDRFEQIFPQEDEFFGNFLKECEEFLRRNPRSCRFQRSVEDLPKPVPTIRRRGYKDKGTLRPYHQRGRNLPYPEPGEDRRGQVILGQLLLPNESF